MGVVRHQRERAAPGRDLLEEPERVVRVAVGDVPLRPVGQRLGPDPDGLDVVERGIEQRLDVAAQDAAAHDHRVPAGDEHAGHLAVPAQVGDERVDVVGRHLELGLVDELRPPEAVGAVGVAGLALLGEEQHGLRVLVLEPGEPHAVHVRRVEQQLAGWVGVESHPDLMRGLADLRSRRAAGEQVRDPVHVWRRQHVGLGEDQAVDRVVRCHVPVDELLEHIGVHAEREHRGHCADGEPLGVAEARAPGELVQVPRTVSTEPLLLDVSQPRSPSVRRTVSPSAREVLRYTLSHLGSVCVLGGVTPRITCVTNAYSLLRIRFRA